MTIASRREPPALQSFTRADPGRTRYLDLLKRCITNVIYEDQAIAPTPGSPRDLKEFDFEKRARGADWPSAAHSMLGLARLHNLEQSIQEILASGVPGDLVEAGAWRGGGGIFMRGVLAAYDVKDRNVWVADTFEGGLPSPSAPGISPRSYSSPNLRMARDPAATQRGASVLKLLTAGTSLEEVRDTFARYCLLDAQVRFLQGHFFESLQHLDAERLALVHVDCDLFDSTAQVLEALYPKLSPGGFVVVDDYGTYKECRDAVDEFRRRSKDDAPLTLVESRAACWQKP